MISREILDGLNEVLTSLENILRADQLTGAEENSILKLINDGFDVCREVMESVPDHRAQAEQLHRRFWFVAVDLERRSTGYHYSGALGGAKLSRRPIFALC